MTVVEGFHYLHHPVTRRLPELLDSGELGELRRVEVDAVIPAPPTATPAGRWSWPAAPSWTSAATASTPTASSPHGPAAPPGLVAARAGEHAGHPGVDEWLEADLEFPNGTGGAARCNMAGDRDRWPFRIVGTHGEATAANFVQPHVDARVLVSSGHGERVEHLGARSSYTYQLEALRAHLRDGAPLPVGPDDPVDTMALIGRLLPRRRVRPPPPQVGLIPPIVPAVDDTAQLSSRPDRLGALEPVEEEEQRG